MEDGRLWPGKVERVEEEDARLKFAFDRPLGNIREAVSRRKE